MNDGVTPSMTQETGAQARLARTSPRRTTRRGEEAHSRLRFSASSCRTLQVLRLARPGDKHLTGPLETAPLAQELGERKDSKEAKKTAAP
jgi:hypothetical protein